MLHCSIVRDRIQDFAIVTDIVARAETVVLAFFTAPLLLWLLFALNELIICTTAEKLFLIVFITIVLLTESLAIACALSGIGFVRVGELFVSDEE